MDNREAGGSSDSRGGSETASCVRVVVRKQRRRGRTSSPRRARPSPSPRRAPPARPPRPALPANCCSECGAQRAHDAAGDAYVDIPVNVKTASASVWNKLSTIAEHGYFSYESDEEAELAAATGARLEVYRLQRGARLVAGAGGAAGPVERAARAARRRVRRLLQEAGGLLRELLALPGDAAAVAAAALLGALRDTALGSTQAAADLALKPALALLHNALLQPLAAAAGAALGELRAALRPLWLLAADVLAPLARLLAAPRLVHLECKHV